MCNRNTIDLPSGIDACKLTDQCGPRPAWDGTTRYELPNAELRGDNVRISYHPTGTRCEKSLLSTGEDILSWILN